MGLLSGIGDLVKGGVKVLGGAVGTAVLGPAGGVLGAGLAGSLFGGGSKKPAIDTTGYAGGSILKPPSTFAGSFGPVNISQPSGGGYSSPGSLGINLTAADVVQVSSVKEARAPRGYRVHTVTNTTAPLLGQPVGAKVAVRLGSEAARILGVRRSKKPPISVKEWEAVKRADRAQGKAATVAKKAGLHVYKTARSASKPRGRR